MTLPSFKNDQTSMNLIFLEEEKTKQHKIYFGIAILRDNENHII